MHLFQTWTISKEKIDAASRFDAKFFHPEFHGIIQKLSNSSVRLGKLCKPQRGKAPYKSEYVEEGIPVLRTDDLTSKGVRWDNVAFIAKELYEEKYKGQELSKGDILLSSTGTGSIGKVDVIGFIPSEFKEIALITPKITLIRIREDKINPYCLTQYLRSDYAQIQIESMTRGQTGQTELYPQDVKNILIPLLPEDVQRKIGDKVKEAEAIAEKKFETKRQLSKYADLVFEKSPVNPKPKHFLIKKEEFANRLDAKFHYYREQAKLLSKWQTVKLASLVKAPIRAGSTPGRYKYKKDEGIPIIKVRNLTNEGIDWGEKYFVDEVFYEEHKKACLENEDILVISAAHSPEGIGGKVDVVEIPQNSKEVMAVAELLIISPDFEKVDPYFLSWVLRSELGKIQSKGFLRGQSAHLYGEDAEEILIPYPPKDLRDEIGELVKEIAKSRASSDNLIREAESLMAEVLKEIA